MVRAAEAAIWSATEVLEALAGCETALWSWDAEKRLLRFTGAAQPLGLTLLAPYCKPEAFLALVQPRYRAGLLTLFQPSEPGEPIETRLRLALGPETLWRGVRLEDGRSAAGTVIEAVGGAAGRDRLTGLLDRTAFVEALSQRLAAGEPVRMVAADMARLRRLNEALGPEKADRVLQALASRLATAFPQDTTPGRIGEDEFAILLHEDDRRDAVAAMRRALEQPLRIGGVDIHPTLWIAETRSEPDEAAAPHQMMRRAALAMSSAKATGKALAGTISQKAPTDSLGRLALEADLHGALERGEIMPFYQPVAHLATGRLAGFEALARWRHPARGLVAPDDFLPLLADAGLIGALGRHMLKTSASQLATWRTGHPGAGDLFVAVNLSTHDLEQDSLVPFIADIIRTSGLPPRALKVEVTESDMMRDPERAAVTLQALRDAGAGVSLDDFGTGFSSLAYLTRLPLETLKIDRYFVSTMTENEGSAKIVKSVASLGRDLGLEVVAEGVETRAVAQRLLELGCEYGQGYGYAPALSAQEAEVYLNESYLDVAPLRASA